MPESWDHFVSNSCSLHAINYSHLSMICTEHAILLLGNEWCYIQDSTVFVVAEFVGDAFHKTHISSISNSIKEFEKTHLFIYESIYKEDEFLASHAANRPLHSMEMFSETAESTALNVENVFSAACI